MREDCKISTINNAIKIIRILYNRQIIINREYLSKELNCSEKQVMRYVKELRNSGVNIKSKSGPTGGYYLEECPFCS